MLASNKGTLMELGISPIITSSTIMQFLSGSKMINIDQSNKEDRQLLQTAEKLLGLCIIFFQASLYVGSGMYGEVSPGKGMLIVIQLCVTGVIVLLLDEVLKKGHGLGSGISLFIATNTCQEVLWSAFGPIRFELGEDQPSQFYGCIIHLIHGIFFRSDKINVVREAFYRSHGANLTQLVTTAFVFVVVIYFQGFRVDLTVKYTKVRGQMGNYPIKLFYTSNMPMILQAALISNMYFFSQILSKQFKNSVIINFLGQWQHIEANGNSVPVGGIAYYISPPSSLLDIFIDPIHMIVYCCFVLITCSFFSKMWIEVSGTSSRDVAKQLRDQHMVIPGHRDQNLTSVLNRYIPTAAALGGMCIGALTIFADLLGCIGSGSGILLAVTIIYELFETAMKESGGAGLLGMGASSSKAR